MKKKVALVTGGYSGEAEISYKSVLTVSDNVDRERYDVYLIDITKQGWFFNKSETEKLPINKDDFSITDNNEKIKFDTVLLCLHGTPGEDGKLQGYFDMLGLPYSSCNAATSAITFNKRYTVGVAAFNGINVAKSLHLFHHTSIIENEITQQLRLPLFVKPNNGGSSIGMSKVTKTEQIMPAIEKAFKEDKEVLVEEFIEGREFTIGVFKTNGKIITMPLTEVISKNEFFDFEAKYHGKSEEITPALVDENAAEKVRAAAKKIYQTFNCKGVIRIDFIYNETLQQPFMLEINTVPGQSAASVVPQQVKAMGWNLKDFYTALIEESFV